MKHARFTVGITGGIGSGKTTVTDYFAQQGIAIIDADVAARVVVEQGQPALSAIAEHFGSDVITNDQLDRKALRAIIFNNPQERQWLEALMHPLIRQQIINELQTASTPYCILVSPLIIEAKQMVLIDRLLVVDVPEAVQLERTLARDNASEQQTKKIIGSQISRQKRLAQADDVVDNSGSMEALHSALAVLHERYLQLSAEAS